MAFPSVNPVLQQCFYKYFNFSLIIFLNEIKTAIFNLLFITIKAIKFKFMPNEIYSFIYKNAIVCKQV